EDVMKFFDKELASPKKDLEGMNVKINDKKEIKEKKDNIEYVSKYLDLNDPFVMKEIIKIIQQIERQPLSVVDKFKKYVDPDNQNLEVEVDDTTLFNFIKKNVDKKKKRIVDKFNENKENYLEIFLRLGNVIDHSQKIQKCLSAIGKNEKCNAPVYDYFEPGNMEPNAGMYNPGNYQYKDYPGTWPSIPSLPPIKPSYQKPKTPDSWYEVQPAYYEPNPIYYENELFQKGKSQIEKQKSMLKKYEKKKSIDDVDDCISEKSMPLKCSKISSPKMQEYLAKSPIACQLKCPCDQDSSLQYKCDEDTETESDEDMNDTCTKNKNVAYY
ncbi:MAG: hypothetical protein Edafosvirus8_1, partial [Edafosvirus sp.]